jgi:hypothetical protein
MLINNLFHSLVEYGIAGANLKEKEMLAAADRVVRFTKPGCASRMDLPSCRTESAGSH